MRSARLQDDIALGAVNRAKISRCSASGTLNVEARLQIPHKDLPLFLGNVQMDMRVAHRTTGIPLWPPCSPAHHLGHGA